MSEKIGYHSGFGGHHESEAVDGALPLGQNSPQKPPFGLYAEQLSGTAFTRPRAHNQYSWLYRIHPSVKHGAFKPIKRNRLVFPGNSEAPLTPPNQMRWDPIPHPLEPTHFVQGLITWAGHGASQNQTGAAIHLFAINKSMQTAIFYNADGEMLIVPQEGQLIFETEMGVIEATSGEIVVIPRGIKFQVKLETPKARGYVLENFGAPLTLPDLGPIGANGLANPRDFLYPKAKYIDKKDSYQLIAKFNDQLWSASMRHHPLDVVAWHGNYAPYKYDLKKFNTINSVSFDHPDPSIFTVLTSQTNTPGVANIDFVIFPERWMVAENTFRPPYFHRNIMSEYMGLIYGQYDAKGGNFMPGGGSLHNCMSAHGPDSEAFNNARETTLTPTYYKDTLAFMFETNCIWQLTDFALSSELLQKDYQRCWGDLPDLFER